jgi:hypothetical protein
LIGIILVYFMMSLTEAKQEFKIRYYHWAASEFEREIDGEFPNLRLFKAGSCWETYRFMQQLDRNGQLLLARSLLKRFHPEAVKALGESCSVEERALRDRLDGFRRDATLLEINSQKGGQKIKSIGKRKLLNVMAQRFRDAFARQCVESDRVLTGDPRLEFQTKCSGGWVISTHFWFGRRESLIDYGHAISSEMTFEHHGPQGPYMANLVIGSLMSLCAWLGICSQTQWEFLTDEREVNHACDTAIKLCGHFFEVAPKLLNGLEVEKIIEPHTPTINTPGANEN